MTQFYKVYFFTLCIFFGITVFGQDSNLYSLLNTKAYADYLFQSENYALAKEEYSRLYFMDKQNLLFQTRILQSYTFSQDIKGGLEFAKHLYASDSLVPDTVSRAYLQLLFHSEYRYRTEVFLRSNHSLKPMENNFYLAANYLLEYEVEKARQTLNSADTSLNAHNIQTILISDSLFHPRSKVLAIGMSTLVPGLGKVYLGQWKDGLASFVYSSLSAWQSYRGFKEKGTKSFYGWTFLAVGSGFYLGNIYGTGKSHRLRIMRHQESIKSQVENVLEASFN